MTKFNFVFARPAKVIDACLRLVVIVWQIHLQVVVTYGFVAIARALAQSGQQATAFLLVFLHHLNDVASQHVILGVKLALCRHHHRMLLLLCVHPTAKVVLVVVGIASPRTFVARDRVEPLDELVTW